jgi:hypothetical protein
MNPKEDALSLGCIIDYASCSNGQAGPTEYNFIAAFDQPNIEISLPTPSGILCFASKLLCEGRYSVCLLYWYKSTITDAEDAASNGNPCGSGKEMGDFQCVQDVKMCSFGMAGPHVGITWTCKQSYPPGSLSNGGGQPCYDTYGNCAGGPNSCSNAKPCMFDPTLCATGPAGPTSNNWFCPGDQPSMSLPNGGGQLCYVGLKDCIRGPNACTDKCELNAASCANGIAGPTPYNFFCTFDQPNTLLTVSTPGSLPNAAGLTCYKSIQDCLNGPNACFSPEECKLGYKCASGQAGPTEFSFSCIKDMTKESKSNGGGQLCFETSASCFNGK